MAFTGTLFIIKGPRVSVNNIIALIAFISIVFVIVVQCFVLGHSDVGNYVIILGLCVFPILRFYALFSTEEVSMTAIGEIIIHAEGIVFSGKQHQWKTLTDADVSLGDYKNKFEYKGAGNFSNNRSAGIRNEIFLKFNHTEMIKGNLLLGSQEEMINLKNILWQVIEKNKLPLGLAKKIVNPESFQEHQRLKDLCG